MKTVKTLICLLINLAVVFSLKAAEKPDQQAQNRPNILFIICDDLNTHVSTSDYKYTKTPTFDSLAKSGMTFKRTYCQYPVCGPSRASLLSGLYPQSSGVLSNKTDIRKTRPNTISMPQFFKENGYWTASVGKVFHSTRADPGEVAWNEFIRYTNDELPIVAEARKKFEAKNGSVDHKKNRKEWKTLSKKVAAPLNSQTPPGYGPSGLKDEQHRDGKNAKQVIDWLKNKSYGEKPFFVALGIEKPHVPFLAPDKYFDMYPLGKIVYKPDSPNLWDSIPHDAMVKRYKSFGFELGKENDPLRRKYMQAYHACVTFIDTQIGKVFEQLKKQGLWDNTIIILTSDHGYHLGDHFMWGKVSLFDICNRVPFIVRVPGTTNPGSKSNAMVELIDIYPTLADLAGLKAPDHLQGVSIVPLLHNPSLPGKKKYTYTVVTRGDALGYAIRNQKWRYGLWPDGEELYDLTKDPQEKKNLAKNPEHTYRLKELRKVMTEIQKQAGSKL